MQAWTRELRRAGRSGVAAGEAVHQKHAGHHQQGIRKLCSHKNKQTDRHKKTKGEAATYFQKA